MWAKNKAATISAAEQHEVGCPLPAAVVALIESIRNWLAMPFKLSMSMSFMNRQTVSGESQKKRRNPWEIRSKLPTSRSNSAHLLETSIRSETATVLLLHR